MDHLVAQGSAGEVASAITLIRSLGMKAGIAGHVPAVFEWAERHPDVDYYMCCYYNPTPRTDDPEHVHGAVEEYREEDRRAMTDLIRTLSRPVIHYKILAAGRNDPEEAFAYCSAPCGRRTSPASASSPATTRGCSKRTSGSSRSTLGRRAPSQPRPAPGVPAAAR